MYIRRKVFSRFVDSESGEERLFSTTDYTLSDEPEQREFGNKENKAAKRAYESKTEKSI